jgi:hypothetical protein
MIGVRPITVGALTELTVVTSAQSDCRGSLNPSRSA